MPIHGLTRQRVQQLSRQRVRAVTRACSRGDLLADKRAKSQSNRALESRARCCSIIHMFPLLFRKGTKADYKEFYPQQYRY